MKNKIHPKICFVDENLFGAGYLHGGVRGLQQPRINSFRITEMVAARMLNVFMYPDLVHKLTNNCCQQQKSLNVLHTTSMNVIKKAIEKRRLAADAVEKIACEAPTKEKSKKAFLDLLLDISEARENPLSFEDIQEEVDTFMFGGYDTISSALGWVIFAVGNHPDVQEKIFGELDLIFNNSDQYPDVNDLARLKYLDCVIKETMRLFPPAPVVSRELNTDVKLGNYMIPAKAVVFIHIHQIHRSSMYFPNPEKFDPSNFFPDKLQNRHPYAYIPFSAKPRNCNYRSKIRSEGNEDNFIIVFSKISRRIH